MNFDTPQNPQPVPRDTWWLQVVWYPWMTYTLATPTESLTIAQQIDAIQQIRELDRAHLLALMRRYPETFSYIAKYAEAGHRQEANERMIEFIRRHSEVN